MTALNIVPECYAETKLVEIVAFNISKVNHQHGCGDVANQMQRALKNKVAIGIIDEDANKGKEPKYFTQFQILQVSNTLILKKHPLLHHYLILVCPEIEKWLLHQAQTVKVDVEIYGLPPDLKGFKLKSKIKNIDKDLGFIQFIKALIKQQAPGIITLQTWLSLFVNEDWNRLQKPQSFHSPNN